MSRDQFPTQAHLAVPETEIGKETKLTHRPFQNIVFSTLIRMSLSLCFLSSTAAFAQTPQTISQGQMELKKMPEQYKKYMKNSVGALRDIDLFKHEWWVANILLDAAQKNPRLVLLARPSFMDEPYVDEVIAKAFEAAFNDDPATVLEFAPLLRLTDQNKKMIEQAAKAAAENDSMAAAAYFKNYADQITTWASILRTIKDKEPMALFIFADRVNIKLFADDIIREAAEKNVKMALIHFQNIGGFSWSKDFFMQASIQYPALALGVLAGETGIDWTTETVFFQEIFGHTLEQCLRQDPQAIIHYKTWLQKFPKANRYIVAAAQKINGNQKSTLQIPAPAKKVSAAQ